jgi:hypothetical protein
MGLSAHLGQSILDGRFWEATYPDDPVLDANRESFPAYNADAGLYYYSSQLFAGAGILDLLPFEDRLYPGTRVEPDVILHGGYLFSTFGKPDMEISGSIRYLDLSVLEYDLLLRTYIREVHWLGLSYQSTKSLSLQMGFKIGTFYLVYSYEAALSGLIRYQAGSHGIHLGVNLGVRNLTGT